MGCVHSSNCREHSHYKDNGSLAFADVCKQKRDTGTGTNVPPAIAVKPEKHPQENIFENEVRGTTGFFQASASRENPTRNILQDKADQTKGLPSNAAVVASPDEANATIKIGLQGSKPLLHQRHSMPELFDIIDVAELMRGLDDEVSTNMAVVHPGAAIYKHSASRIRNVVDRSMSFHTIGELDVALDRWHPRGSDNGVDSNSKGGLQKWAAHGKQISTTQTQLGPTEIQKPAHLGTAQLFTDGHLTSFGPSMKFPSLRDKMKLIYNLDCENMVLGDVHLEKDAPSSGRPSLQRALSDHCDHPLESEGPFFDPELLESYEKDLQSLCKEEWNSKCLIGKLVGDTGGVEDLVTWKNRTTC